MTIFSNILDRIKGKPWEAGFMAGKLLGYDLGIKGYSESFSRGRAEGYAEARLEISGEAGKGYADSFEKGRLEGYRQGMQNYEDAYAEGYDTGYEECYEKVLLRFHEEGTVEYSEKLRKAFKKLP